MKTVKLVNENGKVKVQSPFNSEFVKRAKDLGGKWDNNSKSWIFNENVIECVKNLLLEIYGVNGETHYETCSLVVKNLNKGGDNSIELFGRTILRGFGRNSKIQLGDGIVWINGEKKTTGSMKNWGVLVENGTFEIQNFPIERTKFNDVQKAIQEEWVEIKVTENKRSKEEIEKEIADLEEKLANLKVELNNL